MRSDAKENKNVNKPDHLHKLKKTMLYLFMLTAFFMFHSAKHALPAYADAQAGKSSEGQADAQAGKSSEGQADAQAGKSSGADTEKLPEESEEPEKEYTDKQGVTYALRDGNACYVKSAKKTAALVRIPKSVTVSGDTYEVKGILESAFAGCSSLKNIEIPNSIRSIRAGVCRGCKNLKAVTVLLDEAAVKRSGKNAVVTVKVSEALFDTAAGVKLSLDRSTVKPALSLKNTDTVLLNIVITDNAHYSTKNAAFASLMLEKDAVKAVSAAGKNIKAAVKDPQGSSYYVKVSAGDLKQLSGRLNLAPERRDAGSVSGTLKTDLNKALKKNGINAGRVKVLGYAFDKAAKTNVDLIFPAEAAKAGGEVYIYRYDTAKRVFRAVTFHAHKVSGQGTVTLSVSKGGSFLITAKQLKSMSTYPSSGFLRESGGTYYVNAKGEAVKGWKKIGSDYYYFDRENGKMHSGCTEDGIVLQKDGKAKRTAAGVSKIQTMIKARAVMEQVTSPSDSKSEKIKKCFLWIFQFPYKQYRRLKPIYRQPEWEVTFADDIFDRRQGCCVSEASAAAFLFHECGYKTVYVACDTAHAWVELNGRVYDPLFAEARGFSRYYNVSYASYGLHAVLKRKI